MVQINFAPRQVNAKIVYYGPGMSGKTTNLEIVHQRAPAPNRGDLTSISTDGDRTLFFDFMPLDLGTVAGMRTCFQIYTVPGQVYYNSTRKLVLQGVDGVVFVADSSASMIEENLESMRNLEQNLAEYGKHLAHVPLIIQYNKRDLPDAMSVDELNRILNPHGAPFFEAIANTGQGVFPTLKALAARVLETIHTGAKGSGGGAPAPMSQTGFFPQGSAPVAQPAPAQQAQAPAPRLIQTGFHANPAAQQAGAPRPAAMPSAFPAAPAAAASMPQAPVMGHGQPAGQGYPEALARTAVHAPPSIPMPPMPPAQAAMPMQQPPMQPMHGQPMHGQPLAQQPMPAQPGYGYGQPVQQQPMPGAYAAPQHAGVATMPVQQQAPAQQQGGALHMMRVDKGQAAPAGSAARARTLPTGSARPGADAGGRIQPRAAPQPTPTGGRKRLVYVGVFLAVALGIGAVVAKVVLKLF